MRYLVVERWIRVKRIVAFFETYVKACVPSDCSTGTHLRRDTCLFVILRETKNLVFAGQRFFVSLRMRNKRIAKCPALSG